MVYLLLSRLGLLFLVAYLDFVLCFWDKVPLCRDKVSLVLNSKPCFLCFWSVGIGGVYYHVILNVLNIVFKVVFLLNLALDGLYSDKNISHLWQIMIVNLGLMNCSHVWLHCWLYFLIPDLQVLTWYIWVENLRAQGIPGYTMTKLDSTQWPWPL